MSEQDPATSPSDDPNLGHLPVLLEAVLRLMTLPDAGLLVDGTVGAGGHSAALLNAMPSLQLLGLDRDLRTLEVARQRLQPYDGRIRLEHARFSDWASQLQGHKADLLLLDLGVSSIQLDDPEQGISFTHEGPLDMRMGLASETALELIDRLTEEELANTIFTYGEERLSRRIARFIKDRRQDGRMETTADLARACMAAYPRGRHRIHPATRTFQALRIAVNDELGELEQALESIPAHINAGGRVGVISFHSLEDRIVKQRFRAWADSGNARLLTKRPVTADQDEARANPRSRSAKLRVAEWLGN